MAHEGMFDAGEVTVERGFGGLPRALENGLRRIDAMAGGDFLTDDAESG